MTRSKHETCLGTVALMKETAQAALVVRVSPQQPNSLRTDNGGMWRDLETAQGLQWREQQVERSGWWSEQGVAPPPGGR